MKNARVFGGGVIALAALLLIGSLTHLPSSLAKGDAPTQVSVMNTQANPVPVTGGIPSNPFFETILFDRNRPVDQAVGPGSGTLAITSVTVANLNPGLPQTVRLYTPLFATRGVAGCSGFITGGGDPNLVVVVPPTQTLHLSFPTPVVYPELNGRTCIAAEDTSHSDQVVVTMAGFIKF